MLRHCPSNMKIEEVDRPRELEDDDNLIVDITTGVRTIAEESYALPVIMDLEEEPLRPKS